MDKAEMRAWMRAVGLVDATEAARVVENLRAWMSARLPGTVAAYLAMPDEVEVSGLFDALPGWRWILPRVETDSSLTFRDRDVPREVHPFGMRQPIDAGQVVPVHEIDLLLVPGLAFDVHGGRLGRGGGFYDRILSDRRADAPAVGVTVASRVVPIVPMEDRDRPVDLLATEDGVRECSPSP